MLRQFINAVSTKLNNWEEEDPCAAVLHISPYEGKFRICASWNGTKIDLCPSAFSQYQCCVPVSSPLHLIVKGLETIIKMSGHGKILIKPRRKARIRNGQMHFEILYVISFHTNLTPSGA